MEFWRGTTEKTVPVEFLRDGAAGMSLDSTSLGPSMQRAKPARENQTADYQEFH
jgi:hypothetical protein